MFIVLPPREIQDRIASEVSHRIQSARALQAEAKMIYDQAKQEVERIIVGDLRKDNEISIDISKPLFHVHLDQRIQKDSDRSFYLNIFADTQKYKVDYNTPIRLSEDLPYLIEFALS